MSSRDSPIDLSLPISVSLSLGSARFLSFTSPFVRGPFRVNASFRKALPHSYAIGLAAARTAVCFEASKNSSVLVFRPLLSFLKHLPSPPLYPLFACPSLSCGTTTLPFSQWHHGTTAHELSLPPFGAFGPSPVAFTTCVTSRQPTLPSPSPFLPLPLPPYAIGSDDGCKLGHGPQSSLWRHRTTTRWLAFVAFASWPVGRLAPVLLGSWLQTRGTISKASPGKTAGRHGTA